MTSLAARLIARLASPGAPAFALLSRRTPRLAHDKVELLIGEVESYCSLRDLPVTAGAPDCRTPVHDLLALIPFRQLTERGYEVRDDKTPLQALRISESYTLPLHELMSALPRMQVNLQDGGFDIDDSAYAETVRQVVTNEIGMGEGANFVIRRDFTATIKEFSPAVALSCFLRLLQQERGAYWTFLVSTGSQVLVGASPEVHVRQANNIVVMNPISGTYRYPVGGPTLPSLLAFLADSKEREELTMVVDEELKMMCAVSDLGGQVLGPRLKEMAHLAHTEYELRGHTSLDVRDVLRESMFAATVTGSPLQNAARVISRYESTGRGYYAGALALIGRNGSGGQMLDSPICIRTAAIDSATGFVRIGVGATLVRNSDPDSEAAETRTKAASILSALGIHSSALPSPLHALLADDHRVQNALQARRSDLANFWLQKQNPPSNSSTSHTLVIDAEDSFTAMLAHMLRSVGQSVTVLRHDCPDLAKTIEGHGGLLVFGPGPGNPTDVHDPRIANLRKLVDQALATHQGGVFAVCFGHQMVADRLGLRIHRRDVPHQGTQQVINLFGKNQKVGFYNTYTARCHDVDSERLTSMGIEVSRDHQTGNVYALRGPGLASVQFHPESVLTRNGIEIISELTRDAMKNILMPTFGA
ncbi:chorismate-binding protein [Streptomyces sp. NPDC060085]|uniref:chorismate-binding protein n=1 Tax=Streptomyces sp. NPDC060085 TaxID=3347054 RepID=UPI00364B5BB0